ncbi:MAG: MBL fold metallo-hydrolase [Rhizobiaceae bacterium]|nr:MBL fold metallo-hydrolase [Rhizobiaceae bacterium]
MTDVDTGLNVWQMASNNNRMIELQENAPVIKEGEIELAYFASSAFRITSPSGVSVMIDPWRNLPTRKWDWYFHDFPITTVDIGVSTHAHFDHDALHRLDAHVLIDRLVGSYSFQDVAIHGFADKHSIDSETAFYNFKKLIKHFQGIDISPPNNPRSWDHSLIIVETGDLRILHWGDNRHNPPESIWDALGDIDIVLLPIDGSQHVMGYERSEEIISRLKPKIVIPHHYYVWDVVQRQSTLQTPEQWLETQKHVEYLKEPTKTYSLSNIANLDRCVHYFGEHVAFDKAAWYEKGR